MGWKRHYLHPEKCFLLGQPREASVRRREHFMTQTISDDLEGLRAAMTGSVFAPDDGDYDQARSLFNGEFDRRPAVIARCSGPDDVAIALAFGRERGMEITVRGGGHGTAGSAAKDGALMIDLSGLNGVTVDPAARRARAGGGATLADLDAATQEHGLAVTGREDQQHRYRWADPGRRHGLADPQARPDHRQPGRGRGGDRRRADPADVGVRTPGPVLGAPRRRRELRRGHRVRVPAARGRTRSSSSGCSSSIWTRAPTCCA